MLDSALCREPAEKIELEKPALQMNLESLLRKSLRKEELTAERACPLMAQSFPAKPDEGWIASAYDCAALIQTAFSNQLWEQELDKKNNIPQLRLQLSPSTTQGGALKSSSQKHLRVTSSHRLSFPSLLSIFMILVVSSLTLHSLSFLFSTSSLTLYSLSFHIRSLDQQLGSYSLSFHIWSLDQQLGSYSLSFHIRSLDQQLGSYSLSFHIRSLDQQLGSYSLSFRIRSLDKSRSMSGAWTRAVPYPELGQEQFHIRSLDKNSSISGAWTRAVPYPELGQEQFHIRSLDNMRFHIQSFENMILKKLVALLLESHFAKAASTQLLGNEAWAKYREASQKIVFKKTWETKFFHTNFEENSLTAKTFGQPASGHFAPATSKTAA